MSIALYGIQFLHQSWCGMCMLTCQFQYFSEPKYRLYYQIPHALTMASYLLLDRRCIFLLMERKLGSKQVINNVDEHDKVYLTTIMGFSSFWILTEYARRINNFDAASCLTISAILGYCAKFLFY